MIELLCFDLDGTLVSSKDIHYNALNAALADIAPEFVISRKDHLAEFDGLPTATKLRMLADRGLPEYLITPIEDMKKQFTEWVLEEHDFGVDYFDMFFELKKSNYKLALCTNSIRTSTDTILEKIGLEGMFDLVLTNESVRKPKPDPEMYQLAMNALIAKPENTLIFEDSEKGIASAVGSGAHVVRVASPDEMTLSKVLHNISNLSISCL